MVEPKFKRLSEAYQERDKINKSIDEMVNNIIKEVKVLDKYPIEVNKDGVSIRRRNRLDIIPTEELNEIESDTGTQLMYANDNYYMFGWNFVIAEEKEKKSKKGC